MILNVIRDVLTPTWYGTAAKGGVYLNAAGTVSVAASASSTYVFGIPESEWKVYGMMVGAVCGVLGLFVQFVFKWLEHKHRMKNAAYKRRSTDTGHV